MMKKSILEMVIHLTRLNCLIRTLMKLPISRTSILVPSSLSMSLLLCVTSPITRGPFLDLKSTSL